MSNLNFRLAITQEAKADIKAIANYTAKTWSAGQARKYLGMIFEKIQEIAQNPDIGRRRLGIPPDIRGYKSEKHVIFYRIEGEIIYILRILHEKMDHGSYL